jgi:hypothetical protein
VRHVYALALLLATFIATLHAGIILGLGDLLTLLARWGRASLSERPADILVLLAAISSLFAAHIAEGLNVGSLFWKSGHLASFGDGWYFAGVSHTALGYGDVVLPKPGEASARSVRSTGCLPSGVRRPLFLVLQMVWQHRL